MARLWAVASEILDLVADAFAPTLNPPEVAYVADGNIALDIGPETSGPDSAIVVTWDSNQPGVPVGLGAQSYIQDGYFLSATLSIFVLRAAPVQDDAGNPPNPEDLQAAAQVLLDDADLCLSTVVGAFASGSFGSCAQAAIVRQTPVGPEGGVEGSRLYVTVQL